MPDLENQTTIAFSQILRELRHEKKISQLRLAKKTSLDRTFISLLERGLRGPSLNTLMVIANGLNIEASLLINMVQERSKHLELIDD